jgi:hypothetical protein
MQPRRISSLLTFYTKFLWPLAVVVYLGFYFLAGMDSGLSAFPSPMFLVFLIAVSIFAAWRAWGPKRVSVDANNLYVSDYRREIVVPLSAIISVSERIWSEPRRVIVQLREPTEFGDKIVFLATYRPFIFFSSHPIVNELWDLARSKSPTGFISR